MYTQIYQNRLVILEGPEQEDLCCVTDVLDEPASDGSRDDEWTPRAAKRLKKEFTEGIKKMKEELVTLMSSRLHNGQTDRNHEVLHLSGGPR